jgi:hypothetical protein
VWELWATTIVAGQSMVGAEDEPGKDGTVVHSARRHGLLAHSRPGDSAHRPHAVHLERTPRRGTHRAFRAVDVMRLVSSWTWS